MKQLIEAIAAVLGLRRPPPLVGVLAPPQRPVEAVPAFRVVETRQPASWQGVPSLSEALRAFVRQAGLDGVAIADGALVELDELETAPAAAAVIPKILKAVVALDAYACDPRARLHQNFAYWCRNSGHRKAWYANQVVISEGAKVASDWRFLSDRFRRVAPALDASGRLAMQSHIRISTGHSGHSPRLYFYDDAAGKTGRVHIGFIGGHRYIRTWKYAA